MRRSPCGWLGRDEEGRPFCVHGPAVSSGRVWVCRDVNREKRQRYRSTVKGKQQRARENAQPHARSRKALYDLTRVRPYGAHIAP